MLPFHEKGEDTLTLRQQQKKKKKEKKERKKGKSIISKYQGLS